MLSVFIHVVLVAVVIVVVMVVVVVQRWSDFQHLHESLQIYRNKKKKTTAGLGCSQ